MATAIHSWFVMIGADDASSDATEVARLTAIGTDLLGQADVHLALLSHRTKPTTGVALDQWNIVSASMAAELYTKAGRNGVTQATDIGSSASVGAGYSKFIMDLIKGMKRIKVLGLTDPEFA